MANVKPRYSCPACGFAIFNRRVKNCESCKAALPESLLFSTADKERLQREAHEMEKVRADMARDGEAERRVADSIEPFTYIDFNS